MKAYLAVLIVLGLQVSRLLAADGQTEPKPLPSEIIQTWRDAGANVSWMNMNLGLNRPVFQAEGQANIKHEWWGNRTTGMPVFQFSEWEDGMLMKLPDPGAPFGLDLNLTKMTGTGLKELAGLKNLQALYLAETSVTDAGLKELASLKNLQILNISASDVTDAGLKEVAGFRSLQSLIMWGTKATPAGIAELRKELPKCNVDDE